jgi:putative ABC transport system substrate-binding protein
MRGTSIHGVVVAAVTLGIALSAALTAPGQPREKVPKLAVLDPGRAPGGGCVPGFRQGLRDLGYIEGQTITVDFRYADEDPNRVPILAAELVRQKPDVFWTHSPQGARAAKQATTTIPIVIGVAGYLVEQGLATSLARPDGNITGFETR